jgi:hypothetical protein
MVWLHTTTGDLGQLSEIAIALKIGEASGK